ncbi:nitrate- and nitrite sensing domain-containing protein [Spongiactinospora sp. TRM90649]|uniref:nitrate- and nitrite sensing domain-containing protein n=1 Tax=Spongiactinospora sp. TRM90649 TaxID=3031114 RepID=UPI0023F64B7E|nr:nitrate- and nitrite sensing domain-containing protein [Spongiactinospora sp. TRM90649]MDF5752685.1 nitrate- and nitrite sensing domain-containing protein [Spongiactinospora sp. TRM90649]
MATGTIEAGRTAKQDRGRPSFAKRVFALRNWRVRTRLAALILVPTTVAVLLSGSRVVTAVESITVHERAALAAEYAGRIRDLSESLGEERDLGTWWSYAANPPQIPGASRRQPRPNFEGARTTNDLHALFKKRQQKVDGQLASVTRDFAAIDTTFGALAPEAVRQAQQQISALPAYRKEERGRAIQSAPYTSLITSLLRVHDELATVSRDPGTVSNFRGLSALAHAKEEASKQRDRLLIGSYNPSLVSSQEMEDFIASRDQQGKYLAQFATETGAASGQLLYRTIGNQQRTDAETTKSQAMKIASTGGARAQGDLLDARFRGKWFEDNAATIQLIRQVEKKVAEQVITRNKELADAEQRNAAIAGASILALLLLVLALTVFIARSMTSPLRRLRTEALEIAGFRLPNVVREMRLSGDSTPPQVQPISVDSRDEIGEVATSFDEVHRQAVRLAAEEAELRGNISAMFVNLSRRTQTLVERQISLIDGLEKGEEDAKRLGDLFSLDHLATRMRRNSENLLVLAGHEPTRRRSQPAKLVDVVRASLSEVEDYERVQVKVHRAISVVGSAANDLVHLVAELVENAIQFSPRNTQVTVSSSLIEGGGALLSVIDSGIGMTEEEIAEANRRLAEPPVVDVSVSRRMGLFVVGRLALRHGIRAQLRLAEGNGLIAMVLVPPTLIAESGVQPAAPGWAAAPANGVAGGGAQGFGPFNPAGTGAPAGGLFGSDTLARRDSAGRGEFGNVPGGPDEGFGDFGRTMADHGFEKPASRPPTGGEWNFGQKQGTPDPVFGNAPGQLDPDPFNRAGDPFAQSGPSGGFPTHEFPNTDSRSDTGSFGRPSGGDSGAFGRPSPESDPFTRSSGDSGAFRVPDTGPWGGRGGDSGAFNRPERQEPAAGGGFPRTDPFAPAVPSGPSMPSSPAGGSRPSSSSYSWNPQDDDPATAAMPAVEVSSLDSGEEYLPIFASIESAWFRKPDASAPETAASTVAERAEQARRDEQDRLDEWESARAAVHTPPEPPAKPAAQDVWQTPADEGWRAAAAAAEPALGGITAAGLPKRTPKANLVPGRVSAATQTPVAAPTPMPPVSAERVRSRMSSLQQGVRRGRAEVRDESEPNRSDKKEGQ